MLISLPLTTSHLYCDCVRGYQPLCLTERQSVNAQVIELSGIFLTSDVIRDEFPVECQAILLPE